MFLADDLGARERRVSTEGVREQLVRDLVPDVAHEESEVPLGPLLERVVAPRLARRVPDRDLGGRPASDTQYRSTFRSRLGTTVRFQYPI